MENNENLQVRASHSEVGWRAFMGLCAQRQEQQGFDGLMMNGHNKFRGTPLSPQNQQQPNTNNGKKRAFFDEDPLLQQGLHMNNKRAKVISSNDPTGFFTGEAHAPSSMISPALLQMAQFSQHQQQQAAAVNPLFLNPALFAAAGYANAAAAQQLLLAQSLASSNNANHHSINPSHSNMQQQHHPFNNMIASEMRRLSSTNSSNAGGNKKSDPDGVVASASEIYTDDPYNDSEIACLNLGDEFLPKPGGAKLCDCGMALCHEIGYPNRGTVPFPDQANDLVEEWCDTLDITDEKRLQDIQNNPSQFRLAYWHFRSFKDGSQALLPGRSLQAFVDDVQASSGSFSASHYRMPSQRMMNLHRHWAQVRRQPTLEP